MTENELLDEIARILSIPPIAPDEVTAQMVVDKTGVSWGCAKKYLEGERTAGLLQSRRVRLPNGKVAEAFRRA